MLGLIQPGEEVAVVMQNGDIWEARAAGPSAKKPRVGLEPVVFSWKVSHDQKYY